MAPGDNIHTVTKTQQHQKLIKKGCHENPTYSFSLGDDESSSESISFPLQISNEFWDGVKIVGVADGTYVYSQNFGGFEGNKELFSGHKLRTLQKVMCFGTTRGYWIQNVGGFGGSGRYSDKKLLDYIIEQCEKDLEKDPETKNLISFFDLEPDKADDNVLVVDRGFEGAAVKYMTFVAPKGKVKSKQDGKSRIASNISPAKPPSVNSRP